MSRATRIPMPHGRRILAILLVFFAGSVAWITLKAPRSAPPPLPPERDTPQITASAPLPASKPVGATDEVPARPNPAPIVTALGNGRFQVGGVVFEKTTHTITIPASVNMREGPVEYVLVMKHGKVHESVFVTDADARDVQMAALLLGMIPEPDLGPENAATVVKKNGAIRAWVEWDRNGPPAKEPLNGLISITNPSSGAIQGTLTNVRWLYNGSRIDPDGMFAAKRSGSVISIIRDTEALINNPGASRDNDDIHTPNGGKLPKLHHPVRIVIQME